MNKPPDDIIDMCRSDLEDEVMELRAKLQAMTNERDVWKKRADQLALDKVFGEKAL